MSLLVSQRMNWMSPSPSWNGINKLSSIFKLVKQSGAEFAGDTQGVEPWSPKSQQSKGGKAKPSSAKNTYAHGN